MLSSLQDLSSLTRDQFLLLYVGHTDSQPLDLRMSPLT